MKDPQQNATEREMRGGFPEALMQQVTLLLPCMLIPRSSST